MHRVQRCGLLLQVWCGLSACVYFWDTSMSCATAAQMQFSSRLATYMSERELPLPGDASTHENIDSHRIVSYRIVVLNINIFTRSADAGTAVRYCFVASDRHDA